MVRRLWAWDWLVRSVLGVVVVGGGAAVEAIVADATVLLFVVFVAGPLTIFLVPVCGF